MHRPQLLSPSPLTEWHDQNPEYPSKVTKLGIVTSYNFFNFLTNYIKMSILEIHLDLVKVSFF